MIDLTTMYYGELHAILGYEEELKIDDNYKLPIHLPDCDRKRKLKFQKKAKSFQLGTQLIDSRNKISSLRSLQYGNLIVGLDSVHLLTEEHKSYNQFDKFLKELEECYREIFPKHTLEVQFLSSSPFWPDVSQYSSHDVKTFAEKIHGHHLGIETFTLDGIAKICSDKHTKVEFIATPHPYPHPILPLTEEILMDTINDKQTDLNQYKTDFALHEYWLLIFIGSARQCYYNIKSALDLKVSSKYDRVYIVEHLGSDIVRLF